MIEVVPGPVKVVLAVLAALLVAAAVAVVVGRRRRKALVGQVEVLQAALVPRVPERLNGLSLSAAYRPAEGPGAGGDFYDVFPIDENRVAIVLGDVSGHGQEAIQRSTSMRYTLHAYLEAGLDPRSALRLAGEKLQSENFDFATVVLAIHDSAEGVLSYACAGHPPPIVLGPPAWEPSLAASSPPVGVGSPTGLSQTTVALPSGSVICFFTDGLEEARRGVEMLGRERLHEMVAELDARDKARVLLERIVAEADRASDDMAALIVRTEAGPETADLRIEELEVGPAESRRAEQFLTAYGVEPDEASSLADSVRARPVESGAALLRVTLRGGASSADVLPAGETSATGLAAGGRESEALTLA